MPITRAIQTSLSLLFLDLIISFYSLGSSIDAFNCIIDNPSLQIIAAITIKSVIREFCHICRRDI